ncbi:MAG: flagellar basal body P-ring formation chaperone FlgA [Pseudooceanicola sp.]
MLRFCLIFHLAVFATLSVGAQAATPERLVEEKAHDIWGPQLPEGAQIRIQLADPAPDEAELLSAFWMDRETGRFLANAVTGSGDVRRIQGLAMVTVNVPVPARRMMPGEILRDADIRMVELPLHRVGAFTITAPDKLLGMEVRRMLAQGRQVMTHSVTAPIVIDRGDRVSIVFDDGGLVLTAPGRALDDAHAGQELRIVNTVSNRTLRATAVEDGIVEVIR